MKKIIISLVCALGLVACGDRADVIGLENNVYTVSQMYQLDTYTGYFRYQTYTQEAHLEDNVFYMWQQSFPLEENGQGEYIWFDDKEEYSDGRFSELRLMFNYKECSLFGTVIAFLPSMNMYSWSTLKGVCNDR